MKNLRTTALLLLFVFIKIDFILANSPVENMHFRIRYGIVNAGNANWVTNRTTYAGSEVYHTRVQVQTTGAIDRMFRFRETYESFYSRETGLPYLTNLNFQHGRWRYQNESTFNHQDLTVRSVTLRGSNSSDSIINLETSVFDMVSAISDFRKMDWNRLRVGDVVELQILHTGTINTTYVIYQGREEISIGAGRFRARRFVPATDMEEFTPGREQIILWFSDDMNRIPLAIRVNLAVGSFRLEFDRYERLRFPLRSRIG